MGVLPAGTTENLMRRGARWGHLHRRSHQQCTRIAHDRPTARFRPASAASLCRPAPQTLPKTLRSSSQAQVEERKDAPAPTLETSLVQGLPSLLSGFEPGVRPAQHHEVEPYAERKSTRGRKKEISTADFACLNALCEIFDITDEQMHALVGNGKRGIKNDIQQFRCQSCKTDFSCRRNTQLYSLKTASDRIEMILRLLQRSSLCRC